MTRADSAASAAFVDEHLMARITAGSVDAFGELYDRYCVRALRLARSVCHDEARAEDAVQEAFISIWKSRASYLSQRGTVAAWLLTVVRYRALDIARRDRPHATHRASDDMLDAVPAPGDVVEQAESRAGALRVRLALARLPQAQREVIALAFYGQLSHTEIATRLGLPDGTVKGRMRLGLQKLRGDVERISA